MTPDPEQRLPRELLKELIEEGSDAFRGVLEKLPAISGQALQGSERQRDSGTGFSKNRNENLARRIK